MNVTLTLDNRDWIAFNEVLRIDDADFFVHGVPPDEQTPAQKYAYSILKARKALGLSNSRLDATYNYMPKERHERYPDALA